MKQTTYTCDCCKVGTYDVNHTTTYELMTRSYSGSPGTRVFSVDLCKHCADKWVGHNTRALALAEAKKTMDEKAANAAAYEAQQNNFLHVLSTFVEEIATEAAINVVRNGS